MTKPATQETEIIEWENVGFDRKANDWLVRLRIPTGWMVRYWNEPKNLTSVHDPKHLWS